MSSQKQKTNFSSASVRLFVVVKSMPALCATTYNFFLFVQHCFRFVGSCRHGGMLSMHFYVLRLSLRTTSLYISIRLGREVGFRMHKCCRYHVGILVPVRSIEGTAFLTQIEGRCALVPGRETAGQNCSPFGRSVNPRSVWRLQAQTRSMASAPPRIATHC